MKKWPKLTDKQQFALDCVRKGRIEVRYVTIPYVRAWAGGVTTRQYWAIDTDVTAQIKTLRRRGLIRLRFGPKGTVEISALDNV